MASSNDKGPAEAGDKPESAPGAEGKLPAVIDNATSEPVRVEPLTAVPEDDLEGFAVALWRAGRKAEAVAFLHGYIARRKADAPTDSASIDSPSIDSASVDSASVGSTSKTTVPPDMRLDVAPMRGTPVPPPPVPMRPIVLAVAAVVLVSVFVWPGTERIAVFSERLGMPQLSLWLQAPEAETLAARRAPSADASAQQVQSAASAESATIVAPDADPIVTGSTEQQAPAPQEEWVAADSDAAEDAAALSEDAALPEDDIARAESADAPAADTSAQASAVLAETGTTQPVALRTIAASVKAAAASAGPAASGAETPRAAQTLAEADDLDATDTTDTTDAPLMPLQALAASVEGQPRLPRPRPEPSPELVAALNAPQSNAIDDDIYIVPEPPREFAGIEAPPVVPPDAVGPYATTQPTRPLTIIGRVTGPVFATPGSRRVVTVRRAGAPPPVSIRRYSRQPIVTWGHPPPVPAWRYPPPSMIYDEPYDDVDDDWYDD